MKLCGSPEGKQRLVSLLTDDLLQVQVILNGICTCACVRTQLGSTSRW